MLECTTSRYDEIYAPWLDNPGVLLDLGGYKVGDEVLDLCGGTGAVTREAIRRGADPESLTLLDLNPRIDIPGVTTITDKAERLTKHAWEAFDIVVCRQALGYLDLKQVFPAVAQALRPGGRFVFNSFQRPKRFGWKHKTFEGAQFVEAHVTLGDYVWHIQTRLSPLSADVSTFKFWGPEEIQTLLERDFDVTLTPIKRGYHWKCIRRDD